MLTLYDAARCPYCARARIVLAEKGDYGLADIAYVPWVLRARDSVGVRLDLHPAVAGWLERLLERPALAAEASIVAAL